MAVTLTVECLELSLSIEIFHISDDEVAPKIFIPDLTRAFIVNEEIFFPEDCKYTGTWNLDIGNKGCCGRRITRQSSIWNSLNGSIGATSGT